MNEFESCTLALIEAGRQLYAQNMVPATSGNFSARLPDNHMAITVSGRHKGKLTADDIMQVDAQGQSLDERRPSAETLLHVQIYQRYPEARVVLHPHSMNATVLSRLCGDSLVLQGYELLKALPGITTHEFAVTIPVFDNDQDITRLAGKVENRLAGQEQENNVATPGYLIRGHGFYTWGATMEDALRHVEALDFLFGCELHARSEQQIIPFTRQQNYRFEDIT